MTELEEVYVETIQALVKAVGNEPPRGFISKQNKIHDKNEAKALKAIQGVLKTARKRFLTKFKADKLKIAKADDSEDDIKAQLRAMMASAFAGASDELVAALEQHIDEIAKNFASVYDVEVNYSLVNDQAVQYLRTYTDNYFTTLSDEQADGVQSAIADAMASDEGYSIDSIVDGIRDAFGTDTMYFPDRQMDATDWAVMTARTETARAASFAQKATMQSLDLKTWQWNAQESCCDDCDDNDGEIVEIGDDFPSGDSEPPAHPNCRCITIAVTEELTAAQDDDNDDDDNDDEDKD